MFVFPLSDIRHKYEKKKKRKLTHEEKKSFISIAKEFIELMFSPPNTPDAKQTSSKTVNKQLGTVSDHDNVNVCTPPKDVPKAPKSSKDVPKTPKSSKGVPKTSTPSNSVYRSLKTTPNTMISDSHKTPSKTIQRTPDSKQINKGQLTPSDSMKTPQNGAKNYKTPSKDTSRTPDLSRHTGEPPSTNNQWLSKSSPIISTPSPSGRGRGRGRKRGTGVLSPELDNLGTKHRKGDEDICITGVTESGTKIVNR